MKKTPLCRNFVFLGSASMAILILAFGLFSHFPTTVEPPDLVQSIESASLRAPLAAQDSATPPLKPPNEPVAANEGTIPIPFSVSPRLPEHPATESPAINPEVVSLPTSHSALTTQAQPTDEPLQSTPRASQLAPFRTPTTLSPALDPLLAKSSFPALPIHAGGDGILPTDFGSLPNPLLTPGFAPTPSIALRGESGSTTPAPTSATTATPVSFMTSDPGQVPLLFIPVELLDLEIECGEPLPPPNPAALEAAVVPTITGNPFLLDETPIVIFGDSLSDGGNLFLATSNSIPGPPYFEGRFSTGPIWADILGGYVQADVRPSFAGGSNYAVGGARTGGHPSGPFGFDTQVATYLGGSPNPDALHIVWIGGNDLRDALSTGNSDAATAVVSNALATVAANLAALAGTGTQNILVLGLPNLALVPQIIEFNDPTTSAVAAILSSQWNTQLRGITALVPGASFIDIQAEMDTLIANASRLGITNTTARWIDNLDADPNRFLFTDDLHPTTVGHEFLANRFLSLLPTVASGFAETNQSYTPGRIEVSETVLTNTCAGETIERTYTVPNIIRNFDGSDEPILQRITRVDTTPPTIRSMVAERTVSTLPINDPRDIDGIGLVSTHGTDPNFAPRPVAVPGFTTALNAMDTCGEDVMVTQFPAEFSSVDATTTITLTATDDCGNTAETTTTLTLLPPTMETRILGMIYKDVNADGVRQCSGSDCPEPGVDGLNIYLDLNRNDRLDADEPRTVTARGGQFEFPPVLPGRYRVAAVPEPGDGSGGFQEVVAGLSPITSVMMISNTDLLVSGITWFDINANGAFDENPKFYGISNVVVGLFDEFGTSPRLVAVTTSSVTGAYQFDPVREGDYIVAVLEDELPEWLIVPSATTPWEVSVRGAGLAQVNFGILDIGNPITLASLYLDSGGLAWTTSSEKNTLGFHVTRLETDGSETALHDNLILAIGGGSYALDSEVSPGDILLLRELTTDLESTIVARVGLATPSPSAGSGDVVVWDGTSQTLDIDGPTLINGPPTRLSDVTDPDAPILLFAGELNGATHLDWSGTLSIQQ